MNKDQLVRKVANTTGETISKSETIIDATLDTVVDTLAAGESVKIIGFGQFEVKERAARLGRNPKTNEEVHIPPARKPVFKPGKFMKDAVNK
ncbi:DNA-binding protein HU [bioreactor metagenome]|uniref:DNA-binding protein HU n=1 Tax=bioreactor metagenome TaxID=1076179 RepID=A0A644W9S7_9ZZZZ